MLVIVMDEMLIKEVVFQLDMDLPSEARALLDDFRLAVNNAIRTGLQARTTSRNALNRMACKDLRQDELAAWEPPSTINDLSCMF